MKQTTLRTKINVIIADEHPAYCLGLQEIIKKIPYVNKIDTAFNGNEALEMLCMHYYDLALLDISMSNMSGIEAAHYIHRKFHTTHIIFIALSDDYFSIRETFGDGCQGYLLKDADKSEIIKAIDTVMEGRKYLAEERTTNHLQLLNDKRIADMDKLLIELIYEEKSNKDIASECHLPLRSVENYRHALYHKLGVNNTVGLIRYAIHSGIIAP